MGRIPPGCLHGSDDPPVPRAWPRHAAVAVVMAHLSGVRHPHGWPWQLLHSPSLSGCDDGLGPGPRRSLACHRRGSTFLPVSLFPKSLRPGWICTTSIGHVLCQQHPTAGRWSENRAGGSPGTNRVLLLSGASRASGQDPQGFYMGVPASGARLTLWRRGTVSGALCTSARWGTEAQGDRRQTQTVHTQTRKATRMCSAQHIGQHAHA